jgi:hypothetical protein
VGTTPYAPWEAGRRGKSYDIPWGRVAVGNPDTALADRSKERRLK